MKRLCVVLMGVVMLWFVPASALAQGLFGHGGGSGLTGFLFPRMSGMVSGCNTPEPSLMGTPSVYLGWLEHPTGASWALQRVDSTGTAPWPLKGFWLQVTDDFTFRDGLGLSLSGSVFFPKRSAGAWVNSPVPESVGFEIPSYEWWSLDALVTQRLLGSLELVAGFRWDHTSTRVDYSDNTFDDYILNQYIPFIGAQVSRPLSASSVLVRFVGTPLVPGSLRYHYWDPAFGYAEYGDFDVSQGYLLEFLAEYRLRIACELSLGGFAKWNSLHVQTATRNLAGSTTDPVSWTVDRRSWVIGGSLSLGFATPF